VAVKKKKKKLQNGSFCQHKLFKKESKNLKKKIENKPLGARNRQT
jgi:hypothetical protein